MPTNIATDHSMGDLVQKATREMSALVRDEIALAKTEISGEVGKLGLGAGMLGGAGLVAHFGLLFLSLGGMFGLAEALPLWAAALIVGGVYVVLAGLLALTGKATLGSLSPVPRRTLATLKEDAEWARHPTS